MVLEKDFRGVFTENETKYPLIISSVKQKIIKAILS